MAQFFTGGYGPSTGKPLLGPDTMKQTQLPDSTVPCHRWAANTLIVVGIYSDNAHRHHCVLGTAQIPGT